MMIAADAERGTCQRSNRVTTGSTRMARNAASSNVIQKELAKKQKAITRTIKMAQRSQAMRLNSRGWSKTVELRIDVASTPLVAPTIHVRVAIALAARWRGNFTKRFCAERDERSAKEPQARTVDESSLWLTGTPQPRPARPGTKPQKSRRTLDPHLLPSEDSAVTGF